MKLTLTVTVQVGRRRGDEGTGHRDLAVAAVTGALATPASAAELEARLAAEHGVSPRQARRWVAWALDAPRSGVRRGPKTTEGTTYRLALPAPPAPRSRVRVTAAELPGLDPVTRRDAALTFLALRQAGGRATASELAASIATLSGRPDEWARAAIARAAATCRDVGASGRTPGVLCIDYLLSPFCKDLRNEDLHRWAREPRFLLPPGDLREAAVTVLGEGPEMAPDRTILLVPHLAVLGGSALWSELPEEQRVALSGLKKPEDDPAPTRWQDFGRVALSAGLATAWHDRDAENLG